MIIDCLSKMHHYISSITDDNKIIAKNREITDSTRMKTARIIYDYDIRQKFSIHINCMRHDMQNA